MPNELISSLPRIENDLAALRANVVLSRGSSAEVDSSSTSARNALRDFLEVVGPSAQLSEELQDKFKAVQTKIAEDIQVRHRAVTTDPKNVRIGSVLPSLPPKNILVQELKSTKMLHGLRTRGTQQVKTGHGAIRIKLLMDFPDIDLVNGELRTILGQLVTSPMIPLQSHYIYDMVHGDQRSLDFDGKPRSQSPAHKKRVSKDGAKAAKSRAAYLERIAQIRALASDLGMDTTEVNAALSMDTAEEIKRAFQPLIKSVWKDDVRNLTEEVHTKLYFVDGSITSYLDDMIKYESEFNSIVTTAIGRTVDTARTQYRLPIVHVILENVSLGTMQDNPEGIEAEFTFQFFNHTVITDRVLYRDAYNNWTPSISECPWWTQYYTQVMGQLPVSVYQPKSDLRISFPVPDKDPTANTVIAPPDDSKDQRLRKNSKETLVIPAVGGDTEVSWYVQGITVGLTNLLSRQHVQSSQYPTYQFLGSLPMQASIRVVCDQDQVKVLHRIKRMVDLVALDNPHRSDRTNYISLSMGCLPTLLGYSDFQIDSVTTEVLDPQTSAVTFNLTGFREPEDPSFELDTVRSKRTSRGRLRQQLEELQTMATVWVKALRELNVRIGDDTNFTRFNRERKALEVRFPLEKQAAEILVGFWKPDGIRGYMKTFEGARLRGEFRDIYGDGDVTEDFVDQLEDGQIHKFQTQAFLYALSRPLVDDAFSEESIDVVARSLEFFDIIFPDDIEDWRDLIDVESMAFLATRLSGGDAEYDALTRIVDQKIGRRSNRLGQSKLYPDLYLPTYDQLYQDFVLAFDEQSDQTTFTQDPATTGSSFPGGPDEVASTTVELKGVVDGDTIKVIYNGKPRSVRLLRLNTPERGQPGAVTATNALAALLPAVGNNVTIEFETSADVSGATDKYGRLLCYVFNGATNVNAEMIRGGYTPFFTAFGTGKYEATLSAAQTEAIASDAGLWGTGEILISTTRTQIIETADSEKETMQNLWPSTMPQDIIRDFFPHLTTHSDAGLVADRGKKNEPVVKGSDYVDPDFYFYHSRQKPLMEEISNSVPKDAYESLISAIGSKNPTPTRQSIERALASGQRTLSNSTLGVGEVNDDQSDKDDTGFRIGSDGEFLEANLNDPTIGNDQEQNVLSMLDKYNPNSRDVMMQLFSKSMQNYRDIDRRMLKMFPTFEVFFHLEEKGIFYKMRESYGYNSVLQLDVTRHKTNPSLADIKISNPMGSMDSIRFDRVDNLVSTHKTDEELRSRSSKKGDPQVAPRRRERELSRLLLTEGAGVTIRMGYGSRPEALTTVFTGRIAEIMHGDVVHIIAQGYGGELNFPFTSEEEINLGTLWRRMMVYLGLATSRPHRVLTLVHEIMRRLPTENFGEWGLASLISAYASDDSKLREQIDSLLVNEQQRFGKIPGAVAGALLPRITAEQVRNFFRQLSYDPKLENVGGFLSPSLELDYSSSVLERKNIWKLNKQMTGLQVMRELCMMYPKHIFSVLPYEDRATLYFGPRDGYYFDTSEGRLERTKKVREQLGRRVRISGITEDSLREFFRSDKVARFERLVPAFDEALKGNMDLAIRLIPGDVTEDDKAFLRGLVSASRQEREITSTLLNLFGDGTPAVSFISSFLNRIFSGVVLGIAGSGAARGALNDLNEGSFGDARQAYADVPPGEDLFRSIREYKPRVRALLILFFEFLEEGRASEDLQSVIDEIRATSRENQDVFYGQAKPIRQYHAVNSYQHILANNIRATRGLMKNIIRIFGGSEGQDFNTVSVDDDLDLGDQLIGHVYMLNAETQVDRYRAGYGALAEAMRPMYRGELIIRGNDQIKPHDVVFIYDVYNKMWGPIEVERVVHSYSQEFGYTTTITPHLYCVAEDTVDWAATTGASILWGLAGVAGILTASLLLPGIPFLLGASVTTTVGAGLFSGTVSKWVADELIFQQFTGSTVFGTLMGRGHLGRNHNPLVINPLVWNNEPFVAGLSGFDLANKWSTSKIFDRKLKWLKRGIDRKATELEVGWDTFLKGLF